MPVPRNADQPMIDGNRLDLVGFWRYAGWCVVPDDQERCMVLGEGSGGHANGLSSLQAPDFERPALQGSVHRLPDLRGQRVVMSTRAS